MSFESVAPDAAAASLPIAPPEDASRPPAVTPTASVSKLLANPAVSPPVSVSVSPAAARIAPSVPPPLPKSRRVERAEPLTIDVDSEPRAKVAAPVAPPEPELELPGELLELSGATTPPPPAQVSAPAPALSAPPPLGVPSVLGNLPLFSNPPPGLSTPPVINNPPPILTTPPGISNPPPVLSNAPVVSHAPPGASTAPGAGERRNSERVPLEVEVTLASESHFFTGLSGDISSGGILVSTLRRLRIGTQLSLTFVLPHGNVSTEGTVRWVQDGSDGFGQSVGIRFDHVSNEAKDEIEEFCRARPPLYCDVDD